MITQLHIENFKSLRELDLKFQPISVLVGPNMAGKSNILDVLRFLHDIVLGGRSNQGLSFALTQRGGVNEILWKGGKERTISLSLEAAGVPLHPDVKYKYALRILAGAGNQATIQHESLTLITSGTEQQLLVQKPGGFTQYKNADGSEMGGVGTASATALEGAFPTWDGYAFVEMIRHWRFYNLVPGNMKEPSKMVSGQVLEEPGGDNLSAWLMWLQTHSPEVFAKINEVLRDLMPGVRQVRTIPTEDGNVHLSVNENGLSQPTSVWQASDGFLAMTALLSLIYVPPERGGMLYCIEETENHLHPRLLETLVKLLRQVQQSTRGTDAIQPQFLFTTQSPYFLDQFSLNEVLWVEKDNGQTKAYRPADRAHLRKLVEDKDLGLGELMYTGALGKEE
ncbi:MAG TPA: AAA family ATPase [Terriglobales bacterium]|nr:AAA family ATPase [Terriglobales bacterium]